MKFASPSCVRFISFGFLLATTCVWVWMVCSLHPVTTGSRDRANVPFIRIIINIIIFVWRVRRTFSRAYAFGREMVCSQKSVRNRNFFENAGHVSFSFCQTGSAETHTKPCKTSPQGTSIKRPAIYWDHAVGWGGGVWVSVSDIGRVGKK